MNFTAESGLVKTWVNLINNGSFTFEQVPNMFNLRAVVKEILDAQAPAA